MHRAEIISELLKVTLLDPDVTKSEQYSYITTASNLFWMDSHELLKTLDVIENPDLAHWLETELEES